MSRSQTDQIGGATDLDACKRKLTAVLARLASWHCDTTLERDSGSLDGSDDQSGLDCDRNLMLNRLEWMSLLTRQVSEALKRIDSGSYGRCLRCGQHISTRRLAALPWVVFCTTCQEESTGIRVT